MVASSVYDHESSGISTESEFSVVEDDIYEGRSDSDFAERPGSSWTARLCYIGLEEATHCKTMQGVSLSTPLKEICSATSIDSLTEKVLSAFQILEVTLTAV